MALDPYHAGTQQESWSSSYTDPHNDLTYQWMQEANAFNAEQAQINRDFQREMSDTAYQRAMADMAKAGLNPILAGSLGGASTPGGSQASANFTGAGATSSSSSYAHSQSQNVLQSLYNMGLDAINSAGKAALGKDLSGLVQGAGDALGALYNKFVGEVNDTIDVNDARNGRNNDYFGNKQRQKDHDQQRNAMQRYGLYNESIYSSDATGDRILRRLYRAVINKANKRNADAYQNDRYLNNY